MKRWQELILGGIVLAGICGLIWLVGMKWGWSPSTPANQAPIVSNHPPEEKVSLSELYRLINALRADNQLPPLKIDRRLEQSAATKLKLMLSEAKFDHYDQNNQPNWSFLTQANYDYQSAGENLAFSGQSAWQVFSAWQTSASHSAQLLKPDYLDMGAALSCLDRTDQPPSSLGCVVVLHLAKEK